jgi:hypothetical protein
MDESQFAKRIANIRSRFASKVADKIRETDAALQHMARNGSAAVEAVAAAHRRLHDLWGIGSTLGFEATGRSARILDAILVAPFRDGRGLSDDELVKLREGLEALRVVARIEMQANGLSEEHQSPRKQYRHANVHRSPH